MVRADIAKRVMHFERSIALRADACAELELDVYFAGQASAAAFTGPSDNGIWPRNGRPTL